MRKGLHLMLDAYGCQSSNLKNARSIKSLLYAVTNAIGLKPLSEALTFEVDESMIHEEDTGVTGGIIFMESHFTLHTFPERGYMSADVYSCKSFDADAVAMLISEFAEPYQLDCQQVRRGASLPFTERDVHGFLKHRDNAFNAVRLTRDFPDPEQARDISLWLNLRGHTDLNGKRYTGTPTGNLISRK